MNRFLSDVVEQSENLLPFALQVGVVDRAMARMQLDLEYLLLLGRQVRSHLFLGAPHHQRFDASSQLRQSFCITVFFDGSAVEIGEGGGAGKQSWCSDREQRPQLQKIVLHGVFR